jgi:predicted dehydrogenase
LLRFRGGACGSVVVSQASAGRKNAIRFEVNGSEASVAWDGEQAERLWIGHRERPNEILFRDPQLLHPDAAGRTMLPAAHAEGYADTFRELYRACYADVLRGAPSPDPDYPTFRDGLWGNMLVDAIGRSAREEAWVTLPERQGHPVPATGKGQS